jgi:hypothetical protein
MKSVSSDCAILAFVVVAMNGCALFAHGSDERTPLIIIPMLFSGYLLFAVYRDFARRHKASQADNQQGPKADAS